MTARKDEAAPVPPGGREPSATTLQAVYRAAMRGADVIAHKNREMLLEQKLKEAALEAHPSWREITEPMVMIGKRKFAKVGNKGPGALDGIVKWFKRTHPDEVERIRTAIMGEGSSTEERP